MIAVLDACVIYPPALRDILMWLAVVAVYEPRWSEEIHAEWIRNVLEDRPEVTVAQLERTRRFMDQMNPKSLVSGYERHVPTLKLPDENDRPVLAAAIECGASMIVTFNLKDFPHSSLSPYGVRALPPDAFLEILLSQNQPRFLLGLQQHRESLKRPPKTVEEYLSTMTAQGLTRTVQRLNPHKEKI